MSPPHTDPAIMHASTIGPNVARALRIALGIMFFWSGALHLAHLHPAEAWLLEAFPTWEIDQLLLFVAAAFMLLGVGMMFDIFAPLATVLLWMTLFGSAVVYAMPPWPAFRLDNPLIVTPLGLHLMTTAALAAAGLVVVRPLTAPHAPQEEPDPPTRPHTETGDRAPGPEASTRHEDTRTARPPLALERRAPDNHWIDL